MKSLKALLLAIVSSRRVRILALFLILFVKPAWSVESEYFNRLLDTANTARSADPTRLQESLDFLREKRAELSPRQSSYVDLLSAYQSAFNGDTKGAIEQYLKVLETSPDITLTYRAGYGLVNVYSITRNWTEGLIQLEETLAVGERVGDLEIRQEGWIAIGVFYNQLRRYELTLALTARLFSSQLTGRNLCFSHQIRLEALLYLKRLDPESQAISEAMSSCRIADEPVATNLVRVDLAQRYIETGEHKKAFDTLIHHLGEIEMTGYKRLIAETYSLLSQTELANGNGEQAVVYARAALDHAEGFMLSEPSLQAYWTLKEYYKEIGDFSAALTYEIKHTEAEKGILDDQSKKQLAFQLAKHQVLEKNQQIELLSKENKLLQLRDKLAQESAGKSRLILYFVILLALSLAFWGYFLKRIQRKLKILAEYDGLTGLNNRRHFNDSAENLLRYCSGAKQWASLIMFDMDKFKQINDTYGHSAGDWVLKQAAEAVLSQGRKNDLVGRIGGEEFAILLPSCELKDGQEFAEKCRQAIERIDSSPIGQEFKISASFGVTDCKISGYALENLMSDCDAALYRAKRSGRNRVVCVKAQERTETAPGL